MRPSNTNNLEIKTPSEKNWRVQLVFMKVQAQNYLEPQLEYNQGQRPLVNQSSLFPF